MMEREFAKFFVRLVNELISENGSKDKLFEALRQYKSSQDLDNLLISLRSILDEPSKLELYEYMRPLILLHHQLEYTQWVPCLPGVKLRTVRLTRRPGESLGFAVRGGFEHGVGVFVTQLTPGSQADRQGLKVGDEIVRVNGFTISEAIHDDVLNLIKTRDDIVLRVTHIGMVPVKDQPSVPVKWKYVDEVDKSQQMESTDIGRKPRDLKIFVDTTGYVSFGCGILSGPSNFPGIFIEKVRPGSLAEEVGLEVGDQIVEVNETSFRNITHEQAVLAMKSNRQLTIIIRQHVGLKLFSQLSSQQSSLSSQRSNASYSSHNASNNSRNRALHHNQQSKGDSLDSNSFRTAGSALSQPLPDSRSDRHRNAETDENHLDESQLIAQHLQLNSFGRNTRNEQTQPVSSQTNVEVHSTPERMEKGREDEVQKEKMSPGHSSNYSYEIREELLERKKTQQSSPLSGAAAVAVEQKLQGSVRPSLLGVGDSFTFVEDVPKHSYKMFKSSELDGRPLKALKFKKTDDLGVGLEGGLGSPLNGKIIVSMIFDDGVAKKSGKMRVGDQLMAINGQKLYDITVAKAQTMIQNVTKLWDRHSSSPFNRLCIMVFGKGFTPDALLGTTESWARRAVKEEMKGMDTVELLFCESSLVNEEDTVTYF